MVAAGLIVNSAFNADFKSPVSMGDLSAWTETLSDNGFNSATMELSINNENVAKAFLNLYNADILDESSQNKLERLLFATGQLVDDSVQEIDIREEEKVDYKKIEEEKAKQAYLESQTYVENIPNTDKRIASFRVQTPASKGREYIAVPNQRNRDKSGKDRVEGVQFIAQFLLDINATTQTEDKNPGFHENSRSFDGFVPVVTNQYGDRVVVTYKRYSELDLGLDEGSTIASLTGDMMGAVEPGMEEDVAKRSKKQRIKQEKKSTKDRILSPLRQFKFSDIDWDGEGTRTMKSARELTLKKEVGKSPYRKESGNEYNGRAISNNGVDLIYTPGKKSEGLGKDSYGKFVGGSVTFIFEDKAGNRFFRDVAGPVNQIKAEGESIAKTYGIDPSSITIGVHDVGSFSRKIRANSKGEIPYQEISDLNGEPDTGSALAIPIEPTIKLRKDVEAPTYRSTAEEGVAKLNLQPSKPDVWAKKIAEAGGRGTAQELQAIGFTDYLNRWMKVNKKKSVPKEVAEQYIKDNQIEIVDVTKDDVNPREAELNEAFEKIDKKLDVVTERLDNILDEKEDLLSKIPGAGNLRAATSQNITAFSSFKNLTPENKQLLLELLKEEEKAANEQDALIAEKRENRRAFGIPTERVTRHGNLTLKGGKNYREVLMTLPPETLAPNI